MNSVLPEVNHSLHSVTGPHQLQAYVFSDHVYSIPYGLMLSSSGEVGWWILLVIIMGLCLIPMSWI